MVVLRLMIAIAVARIRTDLVGACIVLLMMCETRTGSWRSKEHQENKQHFLQHGTPCAIIVMTQREVKSAFEVSPEFAPLRETFRKLRPPSGCIRRRSGGMLRRSADIGQGCAWSIRFRRKDRLRRKAGRLPRRSWNAGSGRSRQAGRRQRNRCPGEYKPPSSPRQGHSGTQSRSARTPRHSEYRRRCRVDSRIET